MFVKMRLAKRKYLIGSLAVLLSLFQGACSEGPPPPTPQVFLETVSVSVDANANQDTAVAMDLLIVYEDALVNTLFKLSALEYFEKKAQILRDTPGQMDVWSWEVVPGQIIPPRPIKMTQSIPRGAIVFANYLTPGDHRVRVGKEKAILVKLGPKDLFLTPVQKDN